MTQQLQIKAAVAWEGGGGGCRVMNKDTKAPTEKVPLCRKPAVPTVGNFGNRKVN